MQHIVLATALLLGGEHTQAPAGGPAQGEQFAAPAPRPLLPQPITTGYLPYSLPSSLPRPGTREVWQYYGVDGRGRWVARVILTPTGAYNYHNGAPFPYTTTRPHLYMPYVVD